MQILETHANSTKEALDLTTKYLNVEPNQIQIKVHKKGASGFLGLGDKKPNTYFVYAIEDKTPLDVVIRGLLTTILHKMGYKANVSKITEGDDNKIYVELVSPNAGHLIGKKGKTLEALQSIVTLLSERFLKKPSRILLDIENYRERRKKSLEDMAIRLAQQVEKNGRSKMIEPLNPYERRIIHTTLQDHEKVTTESIGTRSFKRIKVKLIHEYNGKGDLDKPFSDHDDNLGNIAEEEEIPDESQANLYEDDSSDTYDEADDSKGNIIEDDDEEQEAKNYNR